MSEQNRRRPLGAKPIAQTGHGIVAVSSGVTA